MKVTAKKPCVSGVYEVVDEGSRYYISKDACGFLITLDKAYYEPVQEWVDVTHECTIKVRGSKQIIMHLDYELGDCVAIACAGRYRLLATGSHGIRVERKQA